MLDLATYTPMGDKKNSDFFEEYLPRVYERREQSGLNQIVGNMAAVVVQVEHGDAINYLAELAVMGPYRYQAARLTDTHKVYVLQSQPGVPAADRARAADRDATRTAMTRWNMLYPLARKKPNARYIGEVYKAESTKAVREALEPQNIRFAYPGDTVNSFYALRAPDVHVPVGLHLQPGRVRRRRHRRPRRAGAGRVGQPDLGRAAASSIGPTRCRPSTASRASSWASTTRRPGSCPATGSTRCWST